MGDFDTTAALAYFTSGEGAAASIAGAMLLMVVGIAIYKKIRSAK